MLRKILVPLDGSVTAERALDVALQLQPQELVLLRIPTAEEAFVEGNIAAVFPPEPQDAQAIARAQAYLAAWQGRLERPGLIVRTLTPLGDIAGLIIDKAAAEAVDLLVMAAHGRSALRLWLLGGIAERVLRNTYRPVLLVRHTEIVKRMVVLLDGSALAEQILPLARSLAESLAIQITLLNVSDPAAHAQAAEYLEVVAANHNMAHVEQKVISGHVAPAIAQYVADEQVPLLAMVTHGYSGSQRWAYGSVAEKVLRTADCSLLILRPPMG